MVYSSPSILTSVPEYLLVITLSPTFNVHVDLVAVHHSAGAYRHDGSYLGFLPLRNQPEQCRSFVVSSASSILMTTLSANGLIVIIKFLLV